MLEKSTRKSKCYRLNVLIQYYSQKQPQLTIYYFEHNKYVV